MNEFEAFSTTNFEPSERGQKHGRPLQLPVPPLALDAREGPGARVARPALPLGHQPQAHVRGSAAHSRAQCEKPRGERLLGGGEPRETPRRGRRDDDDEREHWVSPRGEERLRLQRRARWDKISSTRAAASSPRSSSAGSSVLSPAGVRPLARLTGVENGADRTPPTIGSSQGDVGFTRSVAGECRYPEPSDPPDPCSNLFKLNNFSNQTQAPTARLFPPASGTLAACGATGRRPPPPEAHPPPHAADAPPPSSSRTTPHSPSSTGRKRKTPGTSISGCRASSSPRMSHRAWVWAGGCP